MGPLFGIFSRGSSVKETAATSERLAIATPKDGHIRPSTSNKKDV